MAKDKNKKQGKQEKDNSTKSAAKQGQMSEEFMKSWQKTYQEAVEAAAKSRKEFQSSDEVKKAREEGKKAGEITAGVYECEKIVEKLKAKPAVVSMTYIRDVMTEYKVEGISQRDMDLLKKFNMGFPHKTKVKTSYPINFKSLGDAYIKRGGSKIPLQKDGKDDSTLIIENGDVIATGRKSYAFEISDSSTCKPDGWENKEYSTDLMLFPESEMKLFIETKVKEPEPSQGDSMVHPSTTITNTISKVELISGIFKIDITREKRDVNNILRLPSRYPEIEFMPGMAAAAGIYDDVIDKLKAGKMGSGVKGAVMNQMIARYMQAKQNMKKNYALCERIYSFIELNDDGSLVIFGGNQVKHMGTGKESGKTITDLMIGKNRMMLEKPTKITVTSSMLYESNCGKNPDRRVEMIMQKATALSNYLSVLSFKAEQKEREEKERKEQKPKLSPKEQAAEGKRVMIEGAKQGLVTAKEIGDKELIEMEEQILRGAEGLNNEKEFEKMYAIAEEGMRKAREQIEKMERESKPILDAPLPPYSPPAASTPA